MKKDWKRRSLVTLACTAGLALASLGFLVWGPHASAARADGGIAEAELKEWLEARWAGEDTAWERLIALDEELKARAAGSGDYSVWQEKVEVAQLQFGWDDPEIELLHARMEGVAGLAERYVEAAGRPLGGPRWEEVERAEGGIDVLAPEILGAMWRVYRGRIVLDYAARVGAERGDWEGLERYVRAQFALARMPMRSPSFLSALQMQALRTRIMRALCRVSAEQCMPADVCRRMAELVRAERVDEEMIREMWRGERAYSRQHLREVHNRHGLLMLWKHERMEADPFRLEEDSGGARGAGPSVWERVWNVRAYLEARMAETARVSEEIARVCEEWMLRCPGSAGEDVREPRGMAENLLLRAREMPLMGMFSTIMATEEMGRGLVRDEQAAVISLLLSAYRAERGEWPRRLEDAMAVEETLDPVTGKPFEYRLLRNHIGVFELYAPERSRGLFGNTPYGPTWRSPGVQD